MDYVIEMLGITKSFPGVLANDNITLQLKKGEIHALLGENGAGKSTLMSVLFGLYKPEHGKIKKDGAEVLIRNPNDANQLGIGMVHQHFKLIHNFTVLQNIILGVETTARGFLEMETARKKVLALSEQYGLKVDPDALVENITVGMQQRVEILKMLYKNNEILIFDEPTAVLTPQEIEDLMTIMRGLTKEGKSILFITHKLNEIKAVADRCTVLRKGKWIGTINVQDTTKEEMSEMMVGRKISLTVDKGEVELGEPALKVHQLTITSREHGRKPLKDISFTVHSGEIVCIAGIDGNGQSELAYAITGLIQADGGQVIINGADASKKTIRARNLCGLAHIPEDRHKHGLILDYSLEDNLILKQYFNPKYQRHGWRLLPKIRDYAENLIERFDIRSGQGPLTLTRSMSGGNQQKAIVAREIDYNPDILIAVQPTRGLDVGAIEYIHKQLIAQRNAGKAVLLISLELDEVMSVSDRILVIFEGSIVGEFNPKDITVQELGLYMAGSKAREVNHA